MPASSRGAIAISRLYNSGCWFPLLLVTHRALIETFDKVRS